MVWSFMSFSFIYFQWLQANGLKFYVPEEYFAAWAFNLVIGSYKGLALCRSDITIAFVYQLLDVE
jgi:hypothetical protein